MKILKLFISLSLILSVSLINSIAAISVSDGSAFVTKAEFAADLNNLSNRMSSLENSLDAKIDSLVSSYLSRNGIWNGEVQEVISDFSNDDYDMSEVCFMKKYNSKSVSKDYLVFFSHKDTLSAVTEVVSKISKSGLCILNFTAWNFASKVNPDGIATVSTETGYADSAVYNRSNAYGWEGNVTYGIYRGKSTDNDTNINPRYSYCSAHIQQKIVVSGSQLAKSSYLQDPYLIAQKNQTSVSFFLEKDEKLFVCFYVYGGGGRYATNAWVSFNWLAELEPVSKVPKGPAFNIGNVMVY